MVCWVLILDAVKNNIFIVDRLSARNVDTIPCRQKFISCGTTCFIKVIPEMFTNFFTLNIRRYTASAEITIKFFKIFKTIQCAKRGFLVTKVKDKLFCLNNARVVDVFINLIIHSTLLEFYVNLRVDSMYNHISTNL